MALRLLAAARDWFISAKDDIISAICATNRREDTEGAHAAARALADELDRTRSTLGASAAQGELLFATGGGEPVAVVSSPVAPAAPAPAELRLPANAEEQAEWASKWGLSSPTTSATTSATSPPTSPDQISAAADAAAAAAAAALSTQGALSSSQPEEDEDGDVRVPTAAPVVGRSSINGSAELKQLKRKLRVYEKKFDELYGRRPCTREEWADLWPDFLRYRAASKQQKEVKHQMKLSMEQEMAYQRSLSSIRADAADRLAPAPADRSALPEGFTLRFPSTPPAAAPAPAWSSIIQLPLAKDGSNNRFGTWASEWRSATNKVKSVLAIRPKIDVDPGTGYITGLSFGASEPNSPRTPDSIQSFEPKLNHVHPRLKPAAMFTSPA